jgi:hypothetical protein
MSKHNKKNLMESNHKNLHSNQSNNNNNNIEEEFIDSHFEFDAPQYKDLTKVNEISNEE